MDYHAIHGHDVSSFDLPSTHRLPTVSAAQALQALEGPDGSAISTGLPALDASLGSGLQKTDRGGIQKGHVTEIWGAPGAGKTAFGIQLAANCLGERRGVVWVDAFHRLPIGRLRAAVGTDTGEQQDAGPDRLNGFTHYTCPTLPHLIALLCRPTAACVPPGTSLVVIDSLSALVNHTFPKLPESRPLAEPKGKGPSPSVRRLQVLQHLVSSLQKLAATRDLAVVVLTQCATKMQAERGATLIPAINASVWEQGVSTRLILLRDWLVNHGAEARGSHFAAIQKLNGKEVAAAMASACAFRVDERGLAAVEYDNTQQSRTLMATPAQKRKLGDTGFEVADSDDEDYGLDDDDELPPMPSQWQGSEDILLVPGPESDEEEPLDGSTDAGDDGPGPDASEPHGPDIAGTP